MQVLSVIAKATYFGCESLCDTSFYPVSPGCQAELSVDGTEPFPHPRVYKYSCKSIIVVRSLQDLMSDYPSGFLSLQCAR